MCPSSLARAVSSWRVGQDVPGSESSLHVPLRYWELTLDRLFIAFWNYVTVIFCLGILFYPTRVLGNFAESILSFCFPYLVILWLQASSFVLPHLILWLHFLAIWLLNETIHRLHWNKSELLTMGNNTCFYFSPCSTVSSHMSMHIYTPTSFRKTWIFILQISA